MQPAKDSAVEPAKAAEPTKLSEAALPWLQELPQELQLVEWLGSKGLLERLTPCDITCLSESQERYMEKHNCQEALWFDLVGAWLKEPFVIKMWLEVAPAPSEAAVPAVAAALFQVFKALLSYHHQEMGRVLRGGRGTGFMAFFYAMDLVRKNAASPDFRLCAVIKGRRYCWTENPEHLELPVVIFWDLLHQGVNDTLLAVNRAGMWPTVLELLLVFRLPYGPWAGQKFWHDLQDASKLGQAAGMSQSSHFQTWLGERLFK